MIFSKLFQKLSTFSPLKKVSETKRVTTGRIGEDLACTFLEKEGFTVVDRNFRKKWGEIDIIAKKAKKLHFIEVKTVSRETFYPVSRETSPKRPKTKGYYRPEDNIHPIKLRKIGRMAETYLWQKHVSHETKWQIDAVTVYLNEKDRAEKITYIPNINL